MIVFIQKFLYFFCGLIIGIISVIKHNYKISAALFNQVLLMCN